MTTLPASDEEQAHAYAAMIAAREAFHREKTDDRRLDWRMAARGYLLSTGMEPAEIRKTIEKIEAECQRVLGAEKPAQAAE